MEDTHLSKKHISEILHTANEYAGKLEDLIKSVQVAEEQVYNSAEKTIQDIDSSFDLLIAAVVDSFTKRKKALKAEAIKIKEDGLIPLLACRELICKKLKATRSYIEEGENILKDLNLEKALEFCDQASFIGSLPAVPNLEEVPDLSFHCPVESLLEELHSQAASAGRVSKMGLVQVTVVEEKPGALLVHWEEVDLERVVDISSFRLQMAYGDVRGQCQAMEPNFHDVYVGPENQHLIRDLRPGVPYTFRVCCRIEGDTEWNAWSLPKVATTHQEPFCWDTSNPNFAITNENKIASKISSDQSVLYSSTAQFGPGHSIEFTILECGVGCSDEGLALVDVRVEGENLLQPGALFINTQGCVFVDGMEKTTKLPPFEKGSKVCFTCEHIRDNKIRVNIDSNNKTVTYDWKISSPQLKLYFAVCFGQKGWKVLVE
ncbi:cytokine receptor-like factor 3 [Anabrus simplex]|uniref:cytokine receptor-like factor 3 n=1 Tax=Anabrus simplex TaxID=316456 RepID=UPI0034DD1422